MKKTETKLYHINARLGALLERFRLAKLSDMHKIRGRREKRMPLFEGSEPKY